MNLMHGTQTNAANASSIEADMTQVLNNSLEVMSKKKITNGKSLSPIGYNIDVLNPDMDIKNLVVGLRNHPEWRICLYGPAGTGKTAFGNHIAEQLEKKLLVRRVSDILDKYVGESEKHIAEMFEQARKEEKRLYYFWMRLIVFFEIVRVPIRVGRSHKSTSFSLRWKHLVVYLSVQPI